MSRLTPLDWERVVCAFLRLVYRRAGQKGSHIKLERPGTARPLIIPRYDQVGIDIISGLIRTAGNDRDTFLDLLKRC